jgi:uncharacterized protein (TIGR03437 family)
MFCKTLAFLVLSAGLSAQAIVLNGASVRVEQPVSPGSRAVITDVGGATLFPGVVETIAPGFPSSYPLTLGGVSLTVQGIDAPIQVVSNRQINFVIPFAVTPGLRPVVVTFASGQVSLFARVMPAAPGLLTMDSATPPRGAILNYRNGALAGVNSGENPAHRGEFIQIYGTGAGTLSQPLQDGQPVPLSPLVAPTATPQVFIGGVETPPLATVMAPTLVGVWIINAIIPDQPFIKGRVPIIVYMNGVDSNEVTVFVD